jgi:putative phosphoesterase
MITVLSDTHSEEGHALHGPALAAVQDADRVVHAGDFTSEAALDAFHDASEQLLAVHGNADSAAVTARLPDARTLDVAGVRIAVTHRRRGGTTGLSLFGRERGADLVVFGHSHRPTVVETGDVTLLNPGSHADPRGNEAAHAELVPMDQGGVRGRIRGVDGDVFREFRAEGR